jgi:hypothetical protein
MTVHLQLRAIRDFVAHNNPAVRVAAGQALDLSDSQVQQFIRASLQWDAFTVDFTADNLTPSQLADLTITADLAASDARDAREKLDQAQKAYGDAQLALAEIETNATASDKFAQDNGSERDEAVVAVENAARSQARLDVRDRQEQFVLALAECRAAADRAGSLSAQLSIASIAPTAKPAPNLIELLAAASVEDLTATKGINPQNAQKLIDAATAIISAK